MNQRVFQFLVGRSASLRISKTGVSLNPATEREHGKFRMPRTYRGKSADATCTRTVRKHRSIKDCTPF